MTRARYVMVGGFLGAGKTTAIGRLARLLTDRGLRVGLITNDQGRGLVDTANLRSQGYPVAEIAGGCFCCRFPSLLEAAQTLTASERPDVFLAEPVGSCTDLVATVSYPLRRIYGDSFEISPLSVLVDPVRAERALGLVEGRGFSRKVLYVFEKQLEEADLIVVNKIDQLDEDEACPGREARLVKALESRFPRARVLSSSARDGRGIEDWLERVLVDEIEPRPTLEIDYDIYAEGEALLGWLNATVEIERESAIDGNALVREFSEDLHARLEVVGAEVAHLKMTLVPRDNPIGEIAVMSLVRGDFIPEVCQELGDLFASGHLVVNLRAEAPPEVLRGIVETAVASWAERPGAPATRIEHLESFRPGRPVPTHRDVIPQAIGTKAGADSTRGGAV